MRGSFKNTKQIIGSVCQEKQLPFHLQQVHCWSREVSCFPPPPTQERARAELMRAFESFPCFSTSLWGRGSCSLEACPDKRFAGVLCVGITQRKVWVGVAQLPGFTQLRWTPWRGVRIESSWEGPAKKAPTRRWELQVKKPTWGEPHTQGPARASRAHIREQRGGRSPLLFLFIFSREGATGSEKGKKNRRRRQLKVNHSICVQYTFLRAGVCPKLGMGRNFKPNEGRVCFRSDTILFV